MKKWAGVIFLSVVSCALWAKGLELGPQARAEADLYNAYIDAVYAELNQDKNAFEAYQKVLALAPESALVKRQLVALAVVEGDIQRADPYADFLEKSEKSARDLTVYAAYKWRKGEIAEALKYYEAALEQNPDDTDVLYQYILILTFTDLEKAVAKLNDYIERYPVAAPEVNQEIGTLYYRKKLLPEALTYYDKATQANPAYQAPYLSRAEIYEKTSRFFLMLHEYEQLEKLGYKNAEAFAKMGSVYVLSGDEPKATEYFLKAKSADPSDIPSAYFLSVYAERKGDWAEAVRWLQSARDYQTDAAKWLQSAFYLSRAGETEQSRELLAQAHKRFKDNVEVGYFYALSLLEDGRYKRAEKVLKDVLKTNPSYEGARFAYAVSLSERKRYKKADVQLANVLELNPQHAQAYNLRGYLLAEQNIRLAEAEEYVGKALEISPQEASYIDSMAWVYYRKGEYKKALDLLLDIASRAKFTPELSYHLGAVYAALGENDKAVALLQKAPKIKEAQKLLKKLRKK